MNPAGSYRDHLQALLGETLEPWIARALPWIIRRSLRSGLHGVWAREAEATAPLLAGGAVVTPNHHAWWDGYLLWLLSRKLGVRLSVLVADETLTTYPYFRRHGAIGSSELRSALRSLQRGDMLVVFPEGEQRTPGELGPLQPGAAYLARRAGVPLLPLAIRVLLRGAQFPEAYLAFGAPLGPGSADEQRDPEGDRATTERLAQRLGETLRSLDGDLAAAPLGAPPPGFEPWLGGAASSHERAAWLETLWRR